MKRRIVFETKIEDPAKSQFTNTATFNGASAEAGVSIERGPLLVKDGRPDKGFNAKNIAWTVLVNQEERALQEGLVTDSLPAGLNLEVGNVKVYELTLQDNGNWTETDQTSSFTDKISINNSPDGGKELKVPLGETNKAYKIEYTTTIGSEPEDQTGDTVRFTNSVTLSDEGTDLANETKTVTYKRGVPITKKGNAHIGYDGKYIDWTIDVNTAERSVTGATVTDTIYAGHELVADSIHIYPLTFDDQGNATKGEEIKSPSPEVNGKTITIHFGDITGAYRITYRTAITDVNKNSGAGFQNTASIGGEGIGPGTLEVSPVVNPDISNKVFKDGTGIDYADKKMSWKLTIRPIKEPMKGLVISDTFPSGGLELIQGSLKVKGATDLVKDNDYTLEPITAGDWKSGFKLTFTNPVADTDYTVTYDTYFDRTWRSDSLTGKEYQNKAVFNWTEETTGKRVTDTKTASQSISDKAAHNGSKSGALRRADRQIDWTIDANDLSEPLGNLVISDQIVGNQELLPESIKVYPYTLNSNGGVQLGSEVTDGITVEVAPDRKSFAIQFDGPVSSPYRIVYTTQLTEQSQPTYENTSKVGGVDYSATVPYDDSEVFIEKSGLQNGLNADWTLTINTSLSTIQNAAVTDRLSSGHVFLPKSLKVYRNPGKVPVNPEDAGGYTVTFATDPETGTQFDKSCFRS